MVLHQPRQSCSLARLGRHVGKPQSMDGLVQKTHFHWKWEEPTRLGSEWGAQKRFRQVALNKTTAPRGEKSKPCSSGSTRSPQLCLRTALLHVITALLIQVIYITHPTRATNTKITSTRLMKIRSSYLTVQRWRCHRIWCWWVEQGDGSYSEQKQSAQTLQIKACK